MSYDKNNDVGEAPYQPPSFSKFFPGSNEGLVSSMFKQDPMFPFQENQRHSSGFQPGYQPYPIGGFGKMSNQNENFSLKKVKSEPELLNEDEKQKIKMQLSKTPKPTKKRLMNKKFVTCVFLGCHKSRAQKRSRPKIEPMELKVPIEWTYTKGRLEQYFQRTGLFSVDKNEFKKANEEGATDLSLQFFIISKNKPVVTFRNSSGKSTWKHTNTLCEQWIADERYKRFYGPVVLLNLQNSFQFSMHNQSEKDPSNIPLNLHDFTVSEFIRQASRNKLNNHYYQKRGPSSFFSTRSTGNSYSKGGKKGNDWKNFSYRSNEKARVPHSVPRMHSNQTPYFRNRNGNVSIVKNSMFSPTKQPKSILNLSAIDAVEKETPQDTTTGGLNLSKVGGVPYIRTPDFSFLNSSPISPPSRNLQNLVLSSKKASERDDDDFEDEDDEKEKGTSFMNFKIGEASRKIPLNLEKVVNSQLLPHLTPSKDNSGSSLGQKERWESIFHLNFKKRNEILVKYLSVIINYSILRGMCTKVPNKSDVVAINTGLYSTVSNNHSSNIHDISEEDTLLLCYYNKSKKSILSFSLWSDVKQELYGSSSSVTEQDLQLDLPLDFSPPGFCLEDIEMNRIRPEKFFQFGKEPNVFEQFKYFNFEKQVDKNPELFKNFSFSKLKKRTRHIFLIGMEQQIFNFLKSYTLSENTDASNSPIIVLNDSIDGFNWFIPFKLVDDYQYLNLVVEIKKQGNYFVCENVLTFEEAYLRFRLTYANEYIDSRYSGKFFMEKLSWILNLRNFQMNFSFEENGRQKEDDHKKKIISFFKNLIIQNQNKKLFDVIYYKKLSQNTYTIVPRKMQESYKDLVEVLEYNLPASHVKQITDCFSNQNTQGFTIETKNQTLFDINFKDMNRIELIVKKD